MQKPLNISMSSVEYNCNFGSNMSCFISLPELLLFFVLFDVVFSISGKKPCIGKHCKVVLCTHVCKLTTSKRDNQTNFVILII